MLTISGEKLEKWQKTLKKPQNYEEEMSGFYLKMDFDTSENTNEWHGKPSISEMKIS